MSAVTSAATRAARLESGPWRCCSFSGSSLGSERKGDGRTGVDRRCGGDGPDDQDRAEREPEVAPAIGADPVAAHEALDATHEV